MTEVVVRGGEKADVSDVASLSKRERIAFLFDHWQDFHETLHAVVDGHVGGADDEAVAGMPRMYHHPSVVELRHAIAEARAKMPVNVAHLLAFYESEWRIATHHTPRKTKKGKVEIVKRRVRERIVPHGVKRKKVQAAFDQVCLEFRGTVHIPSELLEVLVTQAAA